MSATLLLAAALLAAPFHPPRSQVAQPSGTAAPDPSLGDQEVSARVESYLSTIDRPTTAAEWQALGPRAVPLLERVLQDPNEPPSRRAAAVAGLTAIGGTRARQLVLEAARSESQPYNVRTTAIRGAPYLVGAQELTQDLTPLFERAGHPAVRAAAAEVLARHAPSAACPAIRAEARKEGRAGGHLARALERCQSAE